MIASGKQFDKLIKSYFENNSLLLETDDKASDGGGSASSSLATGQSKKMIQL